MGEHTWDGHTVLVPDIIDVGNGFTLSTHHSEFLQEKGLLGKGVLHFANGLADMEVAAGTTFSQASLCDTALFNLIWENDVHLYAFLLARYGADALSANLWKSLAINMHWPSGLAVFKDMPTAVLEEAAQEIWNVYRTTHPSETLKLRIFPALRQRTDLYGHENMPTELAFGILIEEKRR